MGDTVSWPVTLPVFPDRGRGSGGPADGRIAFEPERGPPLLRRATTAEVLRFQLEMPAFDAAQMAVFAAFFDEDLAGGSLAFAFRHPVSRAPGRFVIAPGTTYTMTRTLLTHTRVALDLIRLPGTPWWAAYVEEGRARVPAVVADYDNSVFGIDGARVLAAAVADVAGTFDLYTTATGGAVTLEAAHTVVAGDIPASAPPGVTGIVGFAP